MKRNLEKIQLKEKLLFGAKFLKFLFKNFFLLFKKGFLSKKLLNDDDDEKEETFPGMNLLTLKIIKDDKAFNSQRGVFSIGCS